MDPVSVLLWIAAFSVVCAWHTIRDIGQHPHDGNSDQY
jgi:hypothetical protein